MSDTCLGHSIEDRMNAFVQWNKRGQGKIPVHKAKLFGWACVCITLEWLLLKQNNYTVLVLGCPMCFSCGPRIELLVHSKCLKLCEGHSAFRQNVVFIIWYRCWLWCSLKCSGCSRWRGVGELYSVERSKANTVLCSLFFSVILAISYPQIKWECFGEN